MVIDQIVPPSGDDFINLAGFPGFPPFAHPLQDASPPEPLEDSPESNPAPGGDDNLDDDEDDGDLFDGPTLGARSGKRGGSAGAAGANKRNKSSSAERRATHNAIERARRESLNGRFMELAGALPNMANVKRPSKSVIVTRSLDFVYSAQMRERALVVENNSLRAELNQLRARLSLPPLPPPAPLPLAGDYSHRHFKDAGQGNMAASLTASNPSLPVPTPDYFAANPAMGMGALGAHCHPAQFSHGYATTPGVAPPLSAPANMLTFSGPFQHAFGTGFTDGTSPPMAAHSQHPHGTAQPSSPASRSENDRPHSASSIGAMSARPLNIPSDGSATATAPLSTAGSAGSSGSHSFGPSSLEDAVASAASASSFAALHAARWQQQQQAHFLAGGAQAGAAAGCADHSPVVTAGPWGIANAFAQSAPYMF